MRGTIYSILHIWSMSGLSTVKKRGAVFNQELR